MPRYNSQSQPESLNDFLQSYTVPNVKKLAGLVAGDRYIVVPAENEVTFRRLLRELGYGLAGSK